MTAVVFPGTPGLPESPEQSSTTDHALSSIIKGVVFYALLGGGFLVPIVGGIVGLMTH